MKIDGFLSAYSSCARHSRARGNPGLGSAGLAWIPAFASMTELMLVAEMEQIVMCAGIFKGALHGVRPRVPALDGPVSDLMSNRPSRGVALKFAASILGFCMKVQL